jgi:aconitate hydratase
MPEKFTIDDSMFIKPLGGGAPLEIRRGPNIRPIPFLEPLQDKLAGTVLIKLGDDITTDHIVPAGANFLPIRSNIPELSKHVFRVVDPTFPTRVQAAGGGFIVAGANYGQGSSREQAALCPRYLGVKAVIAISFARIHFANLINFGLLPLTFVNEEDYAGIELGDELSIDAGDLKAGMKLTATNLSKGTDIAVKHLLSKIDIEVLRKGGRLNWIKTRNKK